MRNKPELLAPAGDMERLKMSVLYGADAVYLAGTSFGMRSFAGNFPPEELPEAVLNYVKYIEDSIGCRVKYLSVGPERDEYIVMY